jgi:hypothetical protein
MSRFKVTVSERHPSARQSALPDEPVAQGCNGPAVAQGCQDFGPSADAHVVAQGCQDGSPSAAAQVVDAGEAGTGALSPLSD